MGHTGGCCLLLTRALGAAGAAGASLCPEERGDVFALMPWSILPGHSCSFLLVVVTEGTEEEHPCS